jgi:DNA polymerase II small subunit
VKNEEKLRRLVQTIFDAGYQLEAEAFALLQTISETIDPEEVTKTLIKKLAKIPYQTFFISKDIVEAIISEVHPHKEEETSKQLFEITGTAKTVFHPYAKDVDAEIEILKDPTKEVSSCGSIDYFLSYFKDRFHRLQKILKQRLDAKDASTIGDALEANLNSKVKFIGMVLEKTERNKRIILKFDDFENTATVIVQPTKPNLVDKAQMILLDQVLCVQGVRAINEMIIAEDFLWPDAPEHKPNLAQAPVNVVLTSDFHIGSKIFEKQLVDRFILWLNGKIGGEKETDIAGRVKYIIVAGDLVDGIGVYPQQEAELEISDIYEQYSVATQIIEQIPEYIEVILIPGNHDATRKALPQPAISEKYAEPLYKTRKITFLGNPAQIKIHGVNILVHHGRSLEDLLATLPNINHNEPSKAMIHLLKSRHLAPIYGFKTPIAPEPRDHMIIDTIPDIYHAGHIHIFDHENYRGTKVINSGCWQGRTVYQKKMDVIPTPGIVPVVNLQTMTLSCINFTEMSA